MGRGWAEDTANGVLDTLGHDELYRRPRHGRKADPALEPLGGVVLTELTDDQLEHLISVIQIIRNDEDDFKHTEDRSVRKDGALTHTQLCALLSERMYGDTGLTRITHGHRKCGYGHFPGSNPIPTSRVLSLKFVTQAFGCSLLARHEMYHNQESLFAVRNEIMTIYLLGERTQVNPQLLLWFFFISAVIIITSGV